MANEEQIDSLASHVRSPYFRQTLAKSTHFIELVPKSTFSVLALPRYVLITRR